MVTEIDTIVCETRIATRPEAVFAFFTQPDKMALWMGVRVQLDPRPGGIYAVEMSPTNRARGSFVEVVPFSRVVFTWGWEGEGSPLPPGSTTVEVTLTPDGDGTHVRLVHRGLAIPALRDEHRRGWKQYLSRLAVAALGGDPGPDPNANPL